MRLLSKRKAIDVMIESKRDFARTIQERFEHRAKSCITCETPGACCQDEHFVNVHISRLEAAAINEVLDRLPQDHRQEIDRRVEASIEKYGLTPEGDTFAKTFACPLYERSAGCLVHGDSKPLPCIAHACYERKEDLPPDHLLAEREIEVDELNRRVYGKTQRLLPIPIAIMRA
jgi:hypothetical protein